MKNPGKLFGIISLVAVILCAMAACDFLNPEPDTPDQTPVSGDYDIGNLSQPAGSVTAVTITPRANKSTGARTIHYEGTGSTTFARSTTIPQAAGTYAVTFDVAAVTGWKAATGLSAGTLTVGTPTPVAGDYEIAGLAQTAGSVTAVTITPKANKSPGARTIHYEGTGGTTYTKSTTHPQAVGKYAVTFDVAAAAGWSAATGLSAGTLDVNTDQTPKATDYDIGNLTQTAGSVTAVTINPQSGKSSGARTIYYTGNGGTTYAKDTAPPQGAGTYAVTFDVASASGWNPAAGLSAGTLTVTAVGVSVPAADDFTITGTGMYTYDGSNKIVSVTPKSGKSTGAVTVKYTTSGTTVTGHVSDAGTYAVTFDVAVTVSWSAATGLNAGTLGIIKGTPVAIDYTFDKMTQTADSVTAVIITPKAGKSPGARTIHYAGDSALPTTAGTYAVTFDVAATTNWNAATGLTAGTLSIVSP